MNEEDGETINDLRLTSSAQLVRLDCNCMHDWVKLKFKSESALDNQNSRAILFWRQENIVHYRSLNNFEEKFIAILSEPKSIFEAAEAALNAEPSEDISALFAALLKSGIVTH